MRRRRRNRGVRVNLDSPTVDTVDLAENFNGSGVTQNVTRANALDVSPYVLEGGNSANRTLTKGAMSGPMPNIDTSSSSGLSSDRYDPMSISTSQYEDPERGWTKSHSCGAPERETDAGPLLRAGTVMRQGPLPPAYNDILPDNNEQRAPGIEEDNGSRATEGNTAYQALRLDPTRKN